MVIVTRGPRSDFFFFFSVDSCGEIGVDLEEVWMILSSYGGMLLLVWAVTSTAVASLLCVLLEGDSAAAAVGCGESNGPISSRELIVIALSFFAVLLSPRFSGVSSSILVIEARSSMP